MQKREKWIINILCLQVCTTTTGIKDNFAWKQKSDLLIYTITQACNKIINMTWHTRLLLRDFRCATLQTGVLETWVLFSRRLETRFYKSWSRSYVLVLNLRVLVLVLALVLLLEPQSLGLGLGLGTLKSRSRFWSWDLRPWKLGLRHSRRVKSGWSGTQWHVRSPAFIARKSRGTDIQPQWFADAGKQA